MKRMIVILLVLCSVTATCHAGCTSVYPLAQNATYVKATSVYPDLFLPYMGTDPAQALTGSAVYNAWLSNTPGGGTNQRFHIDLGSEYPINGIYYENYHSSGANTTAGVYNFTFWGSNNAAAFADLTYGTDTNWTQITTSPSSFSQHAAVDAADPKYIIAINATAYRYYAIKIADSWGYTDGMGFRRIELQINCRVIRNNIMIW